MNLGKIRQCPICGLLGASESYPYSVQFNKKRFTHLKCFDCKSVFINPVPNDDTFIKMYSKEAYHDYNYDGEIGRSYKEASKLFKQYIVKDSSILDYGCGLGEFLKELNGNGYRIFGVEFSNEAANFASNKASCKVWNIKDFWRVSRRQEFDAIHLSDVLEHLPYPENIMNKILFTLKPGGVLFIEGPLETNHSLVYWSAKLFGNIKRLFLPNFVPTNPPYHLFRVNSSQQLGFFLGMVKAPVELKYWDVYDTGWPYINGGIVKKFIARIAILMGGRNMFGMIFGNRFRAIFIKK